MNIKVEIGKYEWKDIVTKLSAKDVPALKQKMIEAVREKLDLRSHDSVEIVIMDV